MRNWYELGILHHNLFLIGILLTSSFQWDDPYSAFDRFFGKYKGLERLMASLLDVPVYIFGAVIVFMLAERAAKLTNLKQ